MSPRRTISRLAVLVSVAMATAGMAGISTAGAAPAAARSTVLPSRAATEILHNGLVGKATTVGFIGTRIARNAHVRQVKVSFGDGHAVRRTSLKPVAHAYAKPGVYRVVATLTDTRGTVSRAHAFAVVNRPTTSRLASHTRRVAYSSVLSVTPLSIKRERVALTSGTPLPQAGQVLLIGRGTLDPRGLGLVVESATVAPSTGRRIVTGHDASLREIYSTFRSSHGVSLPARVVATRTAPDGSVTKRAMRTSALPFTCSGGASATTSITVDASQTHVEPEIDLNSRVISANIAFRPVITGTLTLSGAVHCSLSGGFEIPVVSAGAVIVTISPYLDIDANASVTASATWSPRVFFGFVRSPAGSSTTAAFKSAVSADLKGQAELTVKAGITVDLSVAHAAGIKASVGPVIDLTSTEQPGTSCLRATGKIQVDASIYYDAIFLSGSKTIYSGDFYPTTFFDTCWSTATTTSGGGSGSAVGGGYPTPTSTGGGSTPSAPPYVGPSTPETTGSAVQTWTDYASGGGSQGADIPSYRTVGVVCKTHGLQVSDGNNWWYLVASSPWNGAYYGSADGFYNNGQTSGSLHGTPYVDTAVPDCGTSAGSAGTPTTPPSNPTPTDGSTWTETAGSVAHTWTNYSNAGGTEGPEIAAGQSVQIACVVTGFGVSDGNTSWYRIASSPWSSSYYVSADAFYNNGATSGSLRGTPFVDGAVPACSSGGGGGGGGTTYNETTGSVTHTWTNYSNAGGTEGPQIASQQTVAIACKLQGFQVADGNTWWYRIAASPWNGSYYASADAFYNNGATSGSLSGTPWVDTAVPNC
ncbi:PKD domain-containing protein [Nocardioides montaniterrae]